MKRTLCPAELRFVSLDPGPGRAAFWVKGLVTGAAIGGISMIKVGVLAPAAVVIGAVVGGAVLAFDHARRPAIERGTRKILTPSLDVCPWGVSGERQVFRWSDFTTIHHLTRHVQRNRETVLLNLYYLELHDGTLLQSQTESIDASILQVLHERFARASARKIALGLTDTAGAPPSAEGLATELIEAARRIVLAEEPPAWFERLATSDYRGAGASALTPDAATRLRAGLLEEPGGDIDLGPLHIAILAECGVDAAAAELLALTMSPNVVVAAAARAGAMRLGVPQMRTGPLSELSSFLRASEIASWAAWASETAQPKSASEGPA